MCRFVVVAAAAAVVIVDFVVGVVVVVVDVAVGRAHVGPSRGSRDSAPFGALGEHGGHVIFGEQETRSGNIRAGWWDGMRCDRNGSEILRRRLRRVGLVVACCRCHRRCVVPARSTSESASFVVSHKFSDRAHTPSRGSNLVPPISLPESTPALLLFRCRVSEDQFDI